MMKKWLVVMLALCFALPGLAQAAKVKIGFINSITGPESTIGENITNGVTLATEDLKKKGINVELLKEDDTGKPTISMSALERLASQGVAGVVGPYTSSCADAVAKLAEKHKVPEVIPAAAKEEITRQGYKWVFRMNAPANQYASVIIDAALSLGKPKTIAFIYENTAFGSSTVKTAKPYAIKKGLKIVAEESYSAGSPDYRSTLTKIKAQNPDLVFMVSYGPDAMLLMRQAREIRLQPKAFLGSGAGFVTVDFAKEKDVSNHVLSCTQWTKDAKWPGAKDFFNRYKARFGKEPTYHAACGYESMMVLAESASKAGGDREKTRTNLKAGKWNGIMGKVQFADYDGYTNQNRHEMLVEQVRNGDFVTVYPKEYAVKKAIYPFPRWK